MFGEAQLKVTDQLAFVAGVRHDNIKTDYERLTYDASGNRDTSVDKSVKQEIDPIMVRFGVVYDLNPGIAFLVSCPPERHTHAVAMWYASATVSAKPIPWRLSSMKLDSSSHCLVNALLNLAFFDITRKTC